MMESISASSSPPSSGRSRWLQRTLSDLDARMKYMPTLLDRKEKPELLQMLEDLRISYRSLATKYNSLRSESQRVSSEPSSLSFRSDEIQHVGSSRRRHVRRRSASKSEAHGWDSGTQVEVFDRDDQRGSTDLEHLVKLADDLTLMEQSNLMKEPEKTVISASGNGIAMKMASFEPVKPVEENIWPQLIFKVTNLTAENLRQQAELLRRNDEKRRTINELQLQLEQLKSDKITLQTCLGSSKNGSQKHKDSHASKIRRFFSRGCCR